MKYMSSSILIYAFRYALGRMTYAVSEVADALIENKDIFSESHKELICREIREAIADNCAGHDCDVETWKLVLKEFEL
jgi:hypothetical protein